MKKIITVVISVGLLSGCSAFRSPKERISVMTNQPDALIYVNGSQVGRGNVQTKVKRSKDVQIMVTKPGYQAAYYNIDSSLNTTGILDLVGFLFLFLPAGIGLLCPGSKSLDQTNVALNLEPISSPAVQ